jgi:hypothetical protein
MPPTLRIAPIAPGAENSPRATQKQLRFVPVAEGSMRQEQAAESAAFAAFAFPPLNLDVSPTAALNLDASLSLPFHEGYLATA